MTDRLLVITPVRNEAKQIAKVAAAMRRQTCPPEQWIVIDDGSTDDTPAILEQLAGEIDFLTVLSATPLPVQAVNDHLAIAAEARAFNQALAGTGDAGFTHIAKLDGDIELPETYFEQLLSEFRRDPQLGLAGGVLREPTPEGWKLMLAPSAHVRGALKCYSAACFTAIGGIEERLAWDTIDEIRARMLGYRSHSFERLTALHHRPVGSAEGILRGRARHGQCDYILHYPLWWVVLRSVKAATERPRVLSGFAFLGGYLRAGIRRDARVEDPAFRVWVRRELTARALAAVGLHRAATRTAPQRPRQGWDDEAHPTAALLSSQTFADQV